MLDIHQQLKLSPDEQITQVQAAKEREEQAEHSVQAARESKWLEEREHDLNLDRKNNVSA